MRLFYTNTMGESAHPQYATEESKCSLRSIFLPWGQFQNGRIETYSFSTRCGYFVRLSGVSTHQYFYLLKHKNTVWLLANLARRKRHGSGSHTYAKTRRRSRFLSYVRDGRIAPYRSSTGCRYFVRPVDFKISGNPFDSPRKAPRALLIPPLATLGAGWENRTPDSTLGRSRPTTKLIPLLNLKKLPMRF